MSNCEPIDCRKNRIEGWLLLYKNRRFVMVSAKIRLTMLFIISLSYYIGMVLVSHDTFVDQGSYCHMVNYREVFFWFVLFPTFIYSSWRRWWYPWNYLKGVGIPPCLCQLQSEPDLSWLCLGCLSILFLILALYITCTSLSLSFLLSSALVRKAQRQATNPQFNNVKIPSLHPLFNLPTYCRLHGRRW